MAPLVKAISLTVISPSNSLYTIVSLFSNTKPSASICASGAVGLLSSHETAIKAINKNINNGLIKFLNIIILLIKYYNN